MLSILFLNCRKFAGFETGASLYQIPGKHFVPGMDFLIFYDCYCLISVLFCYFVFVLLSRPPHIKNKNSAYRIQQVESEPLYQVQDIHLPPSARVYAEPTREPSRGNSFSQQSPTYNLDYTPRTPTSPPLSDHQEGSVAPPKPARSRSNGRQPPPTLPKPTLPKPTVFR